eukprot:COSAG06_NODE_10299_length_1707_cov_2.677861_2_plen_535_part_01
MSLFALGLRNCSEMAIVRVLCRNRMEVEPCVIEDAYSGKLKGKDGVSVWCCCEATVAVFYELSQQTRDAAARASLVKALSVGGKALLKLDCTAARCAELLPLLVDMTTSEDIALASAAAIAVLYPLFTSGATCAKDVLASQALPPAIVAVMRQASGGQLRRPAMWWKARSGSLRSVDMLCLNSGVAQLMIILVPLLKTLPRDNAEWDELLLEGLHVLKINQEAKLSAELAMPYCCVAWAAKLVGVATREQSRHESLLASGVVDALMWTTAHDCLWSGASLASYTAGPMVALIGRNEGGLTLTHDAIGAVLDGFHSYFDYGSSDFVAIGRLKSPVVKIVDKALPIVDIVISDANKPFVVQHSHAIDDLVAGLLVDDDPLKRRAQDGADKLQATCALALQNLALSDIGKGPLRSHDGVMVALRKVVAADGGCGMSNEAYQYASGALFELDEAVRKTAKAKAPTSAANLSSQHDAVEHVMLSYNWDHQPTIKRINTALKARDYSVWIDIEKMQGSTVEAMSAAVEDCAVMCYGISQAY